MIKKSIILVLFALSILLSGCQTSANVVGGFATGITKDTTDFWHAMVKADKWMKEHLW